MTYAAGTSVSVEKSRAEIETLLNRYGATRFAYASEADRAQLAFSIPSNGMPLLVRMTLPLPSRTEERFTHEKRRTWVVHTPETAHRLWEQACRERWRSMVLVLKAKLDAVTVGISTIEREFLADLVLPNGKTMGETMVPQLPEMYASGRAPLLLAVES